MKGRLTKRPEKEKMRAERDEPFRDRPKVDLWAKEYGKVIKTLDCGKEELS